MARFEWLHGCRRDLSIVKAQLTDKVKINTLNEVLMEVKETNEKETRSLWKELSSHRRMIV
jgi:hypothetical protein